MPGFGPIASYPIMAPESLVSIPVPVVPEVLVAALVHVAHRAPTLTVVGRSPQVTLTWR